MKIFKNIMTIALGLVFTLGCEDGYIDPINQVDPGPDKANPTVAILFPAEGTQIRVAEDITSLEIRFTAEDDIEVQTVEISLDGTQIASFSDFIDYRKVIDEYLYDNLTNGEHVLTVTATDMEGKATTESVTFEKVEPYRPVYDGEIFYMPFDGEFLELVSITSPTVVGDPGFAGVSVEGLNAYAGAEGAYLTLPTDILNLGTELSAVFWLNINDTPDRAGILVVGPPDEANPDAMNNRNEGFRFFRELGADGKQRFKLNVGTGSGEVWVDANTDADVEPNTGEWMHMAFTISATEAKLYIGGQLIKEVAIDGVSWEGTDILSIMSGAPRFTGWGHFSDQSYMDELRIFNKALTQEEIQQIINDESQ